MPRVIDEDASKPMLGGDTSGSDEDRMRPGRSASVATIDNELSEPLEGCGASACCNPSSGMYRFIALILMCLVGFGE